MQPPRPKSVILLDKLSCQARPSWFTSLSQISSLRRPRIPASNFSAFRRSFSLISTPSSIRTFGHAPITSPRYANRPQYVPSGRSRRNLLSSSCHRPRPSHGDNAPPKSFTSSGRYHPSVHGFILDPSQSANYHRTISTTRLKSSISASGIRCTTRINALVPCTRDPMMLSFLKRVSPSSARMSSRKL